MKRADIFQEKAKQSKFLLLKVFCYAHFVCKIFIVDFSMLEETSLGARKGSIKTEKFSRRLASNQMKRNLKA